MRTSIIVHGAGGRMGRSIGQCALNDPAFHIVAGIEQSSSNLIEKSYVRGLTHTASLPDDVSADVIIDFSSDAGAQHALALAEERGLNIVVGTTGLSEATHDAIQRAAQRVAVLVAANTSTGIALMTRIAAEIAASLGSECDVSLVEAHRRGKRDAPSGTALQLARTINEAGSGLDREQIHAVRGGDVFGEHTVRFALPGEYLEISHRATQIEVFARGALRAAAWLRGRSPGRYGMSDVLSGAA